MFRFFLLLISIINCKAFYILQKPIFHNSKNFLMLDQIQAKQTSEQWKEEAKKKWLDSLNVEPSWLQNKKKINNEENYYNNAKLNILEAKKLISEANNQILEAESNMLHLFKKL